jgi:hypothetical protein
MARSGRDGRDEVRPQREPGCDTLVIPRPFTMSFRCELCGQTHEGLPDLGFSFPDPYLDVPKSERASRTTYTPDRCTVREEDGEHYFVRGVIYVPIRGQEDAFGIGAWVSQSEANFERYRRNEAMTPTFGWLVNHMSHYAESTYLLRTRVHYESSTQRPRIEIEPTTHPLSIDQREGITLARAWEIVHRYTPN